jgi:uncharacterized protein YbjT (DUF2867 family)
MPETILVVGATGMLGEPVARRLAKDGHKVRVMSRSKLRLKDMFGDDDTKFEAVEGNVEDEKSLRKAMADCTGVHLNLSGEPGDWDLERRGAEVASRVAAETTGMKRITIISGASTCEENSWFPGTKAKWEAENAVKASGVPYTIFRCTMYMETLTKFVRDDKAIILGKQPNPRHWVAAEDYAAMVSKAFVSEEAANQTFYVYGPEAMTMEEALNIYIRTCAPGANIVRTPFWLMKVITWMTGKDELRKVGIPLFEYFENITEPEVEANAAKANAVLGAPTVTVEAWCEAHYAKTHER